MQISKVLKVAGIDQITGVDRLSDWLGLAQAKLIFLFFGDLSTGSFEAKLEG